MKKSKSCYKETKLFRKVDRKIFNFDLLSNKYIFNVVDYLGLNLQEFDGSTYDPSWLKKIFMNNASIILTMYGAPR